LRRRFDGSVGDLVKRRRFLQLGGAGVGAIALAGLVRATQAGMFGSDAAYEAWTDLRRERGLRAIVAAGVLAANPHNSQPWRFALAHQRIDVHLDLDRALGPVDPFLRQMHLGIGCALENLVVAASMQGLASAAALFPDQADVTLAARLALSPSDLAVSAHAGAITRRHTNRGPYDPGLPLDATTGAALHAQVRHADTGLALVDAKSTAGRAFAHAILQSTETLIDDEAFMRATDGWFRWTPGAVRDHRDGPSLDSAGLSAITRIVAQLAPQPSSESYHRAWLASTRDVHLATAATFGVLAVRDPASAIQRIEAGRLWQRLHLEATLRGLAMQPLDQWLEVVDRARQRGVAAPSRLDDGLTPAGFFPVMMFRCGVAKRVAVPSARLRLDDVIAS